MAGSVGGIAAAFTFEQGLHRTDGADLAGDAQGLAEEAGGVVGAELEDGLLVDDDREVELGLADQVLDGVGGRAGWAGDFGQALAEGVEGDE